MAEPGRAYADGSARVRRRVSQLRSPVRARKTAQPAYPHSSLYVAYLQFDEPQDDFAVALAGPAHGPHAVDHRRLNLDEALAPTDCMDHRAASLGDGEAMASSVQRHDHIRRNTTLKLFAGISVITGAENPADCAIAATASRSRRPQFGLRSRRLRSNAWLLGAVAIPSRR